MKELDRGRHVVVTGPFGIGRTSLLRWVSESMRDRWRFIFIDFERPASEIQRHLFRELFPRRGGSNERCEARSSGARFRILSWKPEDPRRHAVVLDNIAQLSRQKLALLGALAASKRYALLAVVERFVPEPDLERLRTRLAPAPLVTLGRLSCRAARTYFGLASERYGLDWGPERIAAAARATRGYPLGMWQAVVSERDRHLTPGIDRARSSG